ncbi:MAG TPA: hypothetical protein PKH80_03055 [Methanofastidiosum sp.]|nr:hypothetical protein [Methanofastidiosum sp.]HNU61939.1 hypothetical protein [Methanofastidiosum sp.]
MARDKTETIKQRAIYVYLPSEEMTTRWKERADKEGNSISKFVIEKVENSIMQDEDPDFKPRGELIKKMRELEKEVEKLSSDIKIKNIVINKYEDELKHYRTKDFTDKLFDGERINQKDLIDLFKKKVTIKEEELFKLLKIDPKDSGLMKELINHVRSLEEYGLIESTRKGWRWLG